MKRNSFESTFCSISLWILVKEKIILNGLMYSKDSDLGAAIGLQLQHQIRSIVMFEIRYKNSKTSIISLKPRGKPRKVTQLSLKRYTKDSMAK